MMDMIEKAVVGVAGLIILLLIVAFFVRLWRRSRPLKKEPFQSKWRDLQKLCRSKSTWKEAVIAADKLLDEALRKRYIRGHNMGERMVKAQRLFTDNDGLWFAHKLRNKIDTEPTLKLKEGDVKEALFGFRQALKDLGALPDGK